MHSTHYYRIIRQAVTSEVNVVGGISLRPLQLLPPTLGLFLDANNLEHPPNSVTVIYRVELRGVMYYSMGYERVKKRNSYTVAYLDSDGSNKFGLIEYFIFVHNKVVVVLQELNPVSSCKEHFQLSTMGLDVMSFLFPVKTGERVFCFVQDITSKCLFLDLCSTQYVVCFPSSIVFD